MTLILLEGNIASGKSLFLEEAKKFFSENPIQIEILKEPIEKWTDYQDVNLLGEFCDSPEENCFDFELYAMLTMAEGHDYAGTGSTPIIMERSLHSAFEVFIETQREMGYLSDLESSLLEKCFNRFKEALPQKRPNIVIYLQTSPNILRDRIMIRGRVEERQLVTIEYLNRLNTNYEEHISKWERSGVPVIKINTGVDIGIVMEKYKKCFRQIEEVLKNESH